MDGHQGGAQSPRHRYFDTAHSIVADTVDSDLPPLISDDSSRSWRPESRRSPADGTPLEEMTRQAEDLGLYDG